MNCSREMRDGVVVIHASGSIDHTSAAAFEEAVLPAVDEAAGQRAQLVLDLSGIEYMSSVGLRVLMLAAKQGRTQAVTIAVAGLQPTLLEIFQISRFDKMFSLYDDMDAALVAATA